MGRKREEDVEVEEEEEVEVEVDQCGRTKREGELWSGLNGATRTESRAAS